MRSRSRAERAESAEKGEVGSIPVRGYGCDRRQVVDGVGEVSGEPGHLRFAFGESFGALGEANRSSRYEGTRERRLVNQTGIEPPQRRRARKL
jgi:hypothetical protein